MKSIGKYCSDLWQRLYRSITGKTKEEGYGANKPGERNVNMEFLETLYELTDMSIEAIGVIEESGEEIGASLQGTLKEGALMYRRNLEQNKSSLTEEEIEKHERRICRLEWLLKIPYT